MTKVLYIGNCTENTGYGEAVRQMIAAMDSVGIDVVVRPLFLGGQNIPVSQRLGELINKDDRNPDVVIQHTLPHFMEYNGKCGKNIGLFASETNRFDNGIWPEKLNLMDEVWVISQQQIEACKTSGVQVPVNLVQHPCNVAKYQQKYEPLKYKQLENKFVFYWLGEFNQRKNLAAAVKAFHIEFDPDEPVELIIKTSIPGKNPVETASIINEYLKEIKENLKLYKNIGVYKKETLITAYMKESDLMRLHKSGHCFICTSHGEAFCLPAADALGVGNPVIAHNLDYVKHEYNGLIPYSDKAEVYGAVDTFPDLLVGNELWDTVRVPSLQKQMRRMFEAKTNGEYNKFSDNAMDSVYEMSYEKIGNQIKGLLHID